MKSPAKIREEELQKQKEKQEREKMLSNMTDAEKSIYYQQQEIDLQKKIIAQHSASIAKQNEQLNLQKMQYDSMAKCPRADPHPSSLSGNAKGYGVVKGGLGAVDGAFVLGPVGMTLGSGAGNIGRKKVIVTCLKCGKRFKL